MNWLAIEEELIRDEGLRLREYRCSAGRLTIGVGHKLAEGDIPIVSLREAGVLLHADITEAFHALEHIFGLHCLDQWSDRQQRALVNMAFNLGETKLRGFKKMIAAIKKSDWDLAAVEAKDSRWYRQVGDRADRIISQLLAGD